MIHLCCAAERNYVPHAAAMLHSALANAGATVQVHFLHGPDLRGSQRDRLAAMVGRQGAQIAFVPVPDERVAGLPTHDFTGKATWYRIFLPELLEDVDRVLYLDSDLIVLDSLAVLWQTDLAGNHVAAVTNVILDHHAHRPAELGLPGPEAYFNAGVLVMDLGRLRAEGQGDAMAAYAHSHGAGLEWRDQDVLNVVLGRRRLALHPRWNAMNALAFPQAERVFGAEVVAEARDRPAIRHFEGPGANKPWHRRCDQPQRQAYLDHRSRTPWPRLRLRERLSLAPLSRLRS